MSQPLISRNPDLKRLRDDGYDIEIRGGHLLVKRIPHVTASKVVRLGTLVSELSLSGDRTTTPSTHVCLFAGEYPCDQTGSPIERIRHQSETRTVEKDLAVHHSFSSKPTGGYRDHHEKMTTYAAILSSPARLIDPAATPTPFPTVQADPEESVFEYIDTASSRAGIGALSAKLESERVAIVGVGGTGSYILDLVAKTPVKEIHLFDGDRFSQHNAFRAPGAASLEELRGEPQKVHYLKQHYSRMHRGIVAHDLYLTASGMDQLNGVTFVFLCLDTGEHKRGIVAHLEERGVPFIDVGMGLQLVEETLFGVLRVTTSTTDKRDHVHGLNRIPFAAAGSNEYSRNIQIADLNALNAALAVVRWKKLRGFYGDLEHEHFCTYTIDGNVLINEDHA